MKLKIYNVYKFDTYYKKIVLIPQNIYYQFNPINTYFIKICGMDVYVELPRWKDAMQRDIQVFIDGRHSIPACKDEEYEHITREYN